MAQTKYQLKMSHLDERSNIHKLERDGFTRHDIHRVLYNEGNFTAKEGREVMGRLYDRQPEEQRRK